MGRNNGISLSRVWGWVRRNLRKRVLWGTYQFALYTRLRHWRQRRRFSAVADPYRLLRVEPGRIDSYNQELTKQWGLGRVVGGEWDRPRRCETFSSSTIFRGLRQRFEEGYAWEDTEYVQWAKAEFEEHGSLWGYQTLEEFRSVRCAYVDSLYEAIRSDGYRPNATAGHTVPQADTHRRRQAFVHRLEPLVVIGRDGTVHWRDGFHRIVIATLLEVEEIPVQVLARHDDWQTVRDAVSNGSMSTRVNSQWPPEAHPDLQDLLSDSSRVAGLCSAGNRKSDGSGDG